MIRVCRELRFLMTDNISQTCTLKTAYMLKYLIIAIMIRYPCNVSNEIPEYLYEIFKYFMRSKRNDRKTSKTDEL